MATFNFSQRLDKVQSLGEDHFNPRKGRNWLTVDVSGSNINKVWIQVKLDDGTFEDMLNFDGADIDHIMSNAPDGTFMSGVNVREGNSMRIQDDNMTDYVFLWGQNNGGSGTKLERSLGTGPLSYDETSNTVVWENDTPSKVEDPDTIYDKYQDVVNIYYEDGGPGSLNHGYVAILDANETVDSLSNKKVVGNDEWDLNRGNASPTSWRHKRQFFLAGEEWTEGGDTSGGFLVSRGPDPRNFEESKLCNDPADYDDIDGHINAQAMWIDKDGIFHTISAVSVSGGDMNACHFSTSTYDSNGFPVGPWTKSNFMDSSIDSSPSELFRDFNSMYVIGHDVSVDRDSTDHTYWELPGTRAEKTLSDSGGTVEFEYYEPVVRPGHTVEWRAVVEFNDGTTETSSSMSFDFVEETLPVGSKETNTGSQKTDNTAVVQTVTR